MVRGHRLLLRWPKLPQLGNELVDRRFLLSHVSISSSPGPDELRANEWG